MARYIDAERFFDDFTELRDYEYASNEYNADVAPVKHGHWITKPTNGINAYTCKCSCCGLSINCDMWRDPIAFDDAEYCLRCGAKMDEEVKN